MLFSKVILTLHQQEVESNFSFLLSRLALVARLTNRMCQKQCIGISEARSQPALWVLPEHPNACSIPQNPATGLWEGKAKWRGLCRGSGWQPQPTTSFYPTPPHSPLSPSERWKAIMTSLSLSHLLSVNEYYSLQSETEWRAQASGL